MKKIEHSRLFLFAILLKATDGIMEVIGGFLILSIRPEFVSKIAILLTQHELSEDPSDFIATNLIKIANSYSIKTAHFAVFYLLSHGLIKVFLSVSLLRDRLWAYPLTVVFLAIFATYQIYRFSYSHSVFLILLTTLDLIIIWLTWREYKQLRLRNLR